MVGGDAVCVGVGAGEFAEMGSEVSVTGFFGIWRGGGLTRWTNANDGNAIRK